MKHGRTGITNAEYESLKTGILETVLVGDDIYKNTDPRGTFLNHKKDNLNYKYFVKKKRLSSMPAHKFCFIVKLLKGFEA